MSSAKPKKPSTTQQLRDKIKSFSQIPKDELTPWSKLKLATVVSLGGSYTSLTNNVAEDSPKLSKTSIKSSMPVNLNTVTNKLDIPSFLKPGNVEQKTSVSDSELKSDTITDVTTKKIKRKPKPFKLNEPKSYRSVDDLSPEYSGLPFVKKLKILNERQKLAELESAIQTRSLSLDCTDSSNSNEMIEVLTRSQSEASCMTRPRLNATSPVVSIAPLNLNAHHAPIKSPLSPESNETLERKQLKSILKKLSEDRISQQKSVKSDRQDMKRLMRSQTLEGYVARRTKFTKSVTFNHTLSSPPSATLTEEPEESLKQSPSLPSYPSVFSHLIPNPISNAQQDVSTITTITTTTTIDNSHNLLSDRNMNINSDISTNRFNYSDDAVQASDDIQRIESIPELQQTPQIQSLPPATHTQVNNNSTTDSSGTLAFLSDTYGERKLIKGDLNLKTNLFRLEKKKAVNLPSTL